AHAPSRRRRRACNEGDDRLAHVALDVVRRVLFRASADLADEDYCRRLGIIVEELEGFALRRADDRVAADADTRGLADAAARELVHGFIDERPAAGHDADATHREDVAGHNADAALAGGDDARAVRADEPRGAAF